MRNKRIRYATIAILLSCNIFLLYLTNKVKAEKESIMATLYPYAQKYSILQSNIMANIEYSSKKIGDIDVSGIDNQTTPLSSLLSNRDKPLFFLRISERYCNSCVKYFVNLFDNENLNKDMKFIYLTGFQNQHRVAHEATGLGIERKEIYNVPFLDVPIDNAGFPYLMVVNKNMEIEYCYFPTKSNEKIDLENINMIIDCYAKKYK